MDERACAWPWRVSCPRGWHRWRSMQVSHLRNGGWIGHGERPRIRRDVLEWGGPIAHSLTAGLGCNGFLAEGVCPESRLHLEASTAVNGNDGGGMEPCPGQGSWGCLVDMARGSGYRRREMRKQIESNEVGSLAFQHPSSRLARRSATAAEAMDGARSASWPRRSCDWHGGLGGSGGWTPGRRRGAGCR